MGSEMINHSANEYDYIGVDGGVRNQLPINMNSENRYELPTRSQKQQKKATEEAIFAGNISKQKGHLPTASRINWSNIKSGLLILFILLTLVFTFFFVKEQLRDAKLQKVIDLLKKPEYTSMILLGGWDDDITNSITIYNSMEKSWKNCNLTLPSTLGYHGAAFLNIELYIFGGYKDGTAKEPLKSLYKLEAGNKWERMADMTEKRVSISQSSVVLNSEIWVIGGWNGTNILKSVEKYNPKTNNWTKMPELNESRTAAAATVVDGKIYVSGGWDGQKTKNSVEVYDPEKEKWEIFTPSLPYAVHSHILIRNNSHLIAIGGDFSDQEPTNRVWKIDVLDPKREWNNMPSLQQSRYDSGAAIIADELIVFGGSINKSTRVDSVEVFDGVEWKNGAPLPERRGTFAYIPLTYAQKTFFFNEFREILNF